MKLRPFGAIILGCVLVTAVACKKNNPVNAPTLEGKIVSYNEFGAAMLDLTESNMTEAGFTLGDNISITVDGEEIEMPYFDGYYTHTGDYLCVAYPSYPSICFTANNTGLPEEFTGLEGFPVTIRLIAKGGSIDVQEALSMKYSNSRSDYPDITNAEFANARSVTAGNIVAGKLYRCSSPFSDEIGRASYVSTFLEEENAKTVLNLTDTDDKMLTYEMPAYSKSLWDAGSVILCPLKADPTADDYNNRLIEALKELPLHPAPYVVHCTEGKDRTGYVCALLEGLCGATYEEIVADYLVTYSNYYQKTPETDSKVCDALVSLRLNPCLMYYASVSDESLLPNIDYTDSFFKYLLSHGMTDRQIDNLVQVLCE